ncbi:hypothetical protein RFI_14931 [Reticulomyxa filosa]|uniref:Uncharacterized protein n=1 Tax=Reticulomyxa filosa TaxID=46433 RepID=X6N892_RETFI|nr:hypothetical protein RFI_14931 [Reticulomyxa filosa]|eukprot:ETO22271.1 hypothetical protein RFI_14931 [Reticulomyxa filosa]
MNSSHSELMKLLSKKLKVPYEEQALLFLTDDCRTLSSQSLPNKTFNDNLMPCVLPYSLHIELAKYPISFIVHAAYCNTITIIQLLLEEIKITIMSEYVQKYSIKENKWTLFQNTLHSPLSNCVAILNEGDKVCICDPSKLEKLFFFDQVLKDKFLNKNTFCKRAYSISKLSFWTSKIKKRVCCSKRNLISITHKKIFDSFFAKNYNFILKSFVICKELYRSKLILKEFNSTYNFFIYEENAGRNANEKESKKYSRKIKILMQLKENVKEKELIKHLEEMHGNVSTVIEKVVLIPMTNQVTNY